MSTASESRLSSLDRLLDEADSRQPGSVNDDFAPQLFAVVDSLESSATLRRAVTDPGTPEGARKALVHGLYDGKVSAVVADLVAEAAAMRWAGGRSFAAALERQAVRGQLKVASAKGELGEVEDELFRFARVVESDPQLRNALSDRSVPVANRQELVGELLAGRSTASTGVLAKRAVSARERTFAHTIEGFVTLAAAQQQRVVATVRVAQALTVEQRERLRRSLQAQVGREVAVQEVLDPTVLGGVRVELGDEVIEGTVADRLSAARRLFA